MKNIDKYAPSSGRVIKEDDSIINTADLLEQIAESVSGGTVGIQELYGPDIATRPAANTVLAGSTFIVVTDPIVIYMSDGNQWIEV